jgi:DNA-directed RNA polymerase I, II, and III subunit RPABC2
MPPKKAAKLPVVKTKQVRFSKSKKAEDDDESNENILKNAPKPVLYEPKSELDFTDEELTKQAELEKELETEIEEETEADEDEKEELDETEKDEDHEIDDDVEYDGDKDEEGLEGADNIDDLYDEDTKPKKKKLKKIEEDEDDEELDDDMCDYDYGEIYDEKKEEPMIIVEDNKRITFPKLTKYERVRLIGSRAKQIALGAKVLIKNTNGLSPIEIAKLELNERMIPMKIKRILPDNKVEIWKLSELDIEN